MDEPLSQGYLGGLDVVWQRVNEEVTNGFPRLSHALRLVQGDAELFHGALDLQQLLQGPFDVAVLVDTAGGELLPQLAGDGGLFPHKSADVLDAVSWGGICKGSSSEGEDTGGWEVRLRWEGEELWGGQRGV